MSKPLTVAILLILIFFADLMAIRQTLSFWQNTQILDEGFSFVPLLAAQIAVAAALLFCGVFVAYKSFAGKS